MSTASHAQIVMANYGWEAGVAIDVALVCMVLAAIAIPVGAVALLVRFLTRGGRPSTRHLIRWTICVPGRTIATLGSCERRARDEHPVVIRAIKSVNAVVQIGLI
jgi:hypothetical protein